jgi:DNA-binding IclR family transcriptional regulator
LHVAGQDFTDPEPGPGARVPQRRRQDAADHAARARSGGAAAQGQRAGGRPGEPGEFAAICRDIEAVRKRGYAISLGTSMPGAAALAVLIPVARDRGPMTLSVGGPMREVQTDRDRLAQVLTQAIDPLRKAAGA